MSQDEIFRRVRLEFDEQMYPRSPSSTSPAECKIRALGIWPPRAVVPVIFIPGIMGSNLRNAKQKKNAWVPPNGAIAGLGEAWRRGGQRPVTRQEQLTADDCEVFDYDKGVAIPEKYLALDPNEAQRRHWGEVHADSYLDILLALEEKLNFPFDGLEYGKPKTIKDWEKAMAPSKKWVPKAPLTEPEFKGRMGNIYFPVYACGYNWLQSNEKSAQRVVDRVQEIEKRLQNNCYYSYSGKVILVTHSMGGLVARRAVQLLGKKVLGVVHGVQPVTGAPAVYRRFKAGTETNGMFDIPGAVAAVILGWDAADVTCVLGNSPGPMELLPTKHYEPGWLQITDGAKIIRLPKEDPYTEIYEVSAEDKWWGMVDSELLDPAGQINVSEEQTLHGNFKSGLNKARAFHDTIKLTCHPNTYAYYGDDQSQRSFHKVVWRAFTNQLHGLGEEEILGAKRTEAELTGRTRVAINGRHIAFSLDGKDGPGDGTVPTPSGQAVAKLEGIKDVYRLDGFDHQMSYKNNIAQHTVLYAIGKLAQQIKLKEDGTCEPS